MNKRIKGQSIVELVVGLLAIVLVIMGILQVGKLGMEHTQALMQARELADELAINEDFEPLSPGAEYIWRVSEGGDERSYSLDDERLPGDPQPLIDNIVEHSKPADLRTWMPSNQVSPRMYPDRFMGGFDYTVGHTYSERIELYPIIRNLVVEDEYLRMRRRVLMPWLRGL